MTVGVSRRRGILGWLCTAAITAGLVLEAPIGIPSAAADCPDIEVVFARGSGNEPGPGEVGAAFSDALRSKVGGRSVGVYGVNYPADVNFLMVADGVADATNHVRWMAANCPNAKIVLGGFSQGAAVVDILAGAPVPGLNAVPALALIPGINVLPQGLLPNFADAAPMPGDLADRVAAVAVFGNPLGKVSGPLASPVFGGKVIDLCFPGDPVCSDGNDMNTHHYYVPGMTDQAATFVAGLV
jgi:cutinase